MAFAPEAASCLAIYNILMLFLIAGFNKCSPVTFTLPGPVTRSLCKRRVPCEALITAAADVHRKELLKYTGIPGKEWQSGSIATLFRISLHECSYISRMSTVQRCDTTGYRRMALNIS